MLPVSPKPGLWLSQLGIRFKVIGPSRVAALQSPSHPRAQSQGPTEACLGREPQFWVRTASTRDSGSATY